MSTPVIQSSFNSGELSPYMRGRAELQVYQNGCKEITNFIPYPQGGVSTRTGTKFLNDTLITPTISANVREIEFAPNSDESFVIVLFGGQMNIYESGVASPVFTKTGAPWSVNQINEVVVDYQVDLMYLTHGSVEPYVLKYKGAAASPRFELETVESQTSFKAPPFLKNDTSNTELIVSDEEYFVKLESTVDGDFNSLVGVNLSTTETYIEIKIKNKWALYRLADTNLGAPADPTTDGGFCWAIPVTAVVEDLEPSAQLIHLGKSATAADNYVDPHPELEDGEYELRSDTLIWNYDLEDSFIRFENSYEKVANGFDGAGVTPEGVKWVKLNEYIGQEDFATEYLVDTGPTGKIIWTEDFEQGQVYKIVASRKTGTPPNDYYPGFRNAAPAKAEGTGTGFSRDEADFSYSFVYKYPGDTFAATNHFQWLGFTSGTAAEPIIFANLSKSQTFDVMKVSETKTFWSPVSGVGDHQYTGTITFDDDSEIHTATIVSSKDLFTLSDEGRYLMFRLGDEWVTCVIDSYTSTKEVDVTLKDVIPTKKNTDEFVDNGRTSQFRFSAWYTGNYPFSVALHEQRLCFGGTPSNPETVWMSKITDSYDFRTIERDGKVLDTTGITYDLGGRAYNRIRSMTSGATLVISTEGAEWQLRPNNFGDALTPTNIRMTQETFIGSTLRCLRAGSSVFFVERSGKYVYELSYDYQIDGFKSTDLTVLANHLFAEDSIVDFCHQQTPRSVFWFLTESGKVYTLTYEKERNVYAWARHTTRTGDKIRAVSIMRRNATTTEDTVYFVVERDSAYLIESLTPDFVDDGTDNYKANLWTLDSAVRFPSTEGTYLYSPVSIDDIDQQAIPVAVVTDTSHGYTTGDTIRISGTSLVGLDDRIFKITVTAADEFDLYDLDGTTPIDLRISNPEVIIASTLTGPNQYDLQISAFGPHYYKVGDSVTITNPFDGDALEGVGTVSSITATNVVVEMVSGTAPVDRDIKLTNYSELWSSGGTVALNYSYLNGLDHMDGQEVSVIIDGAYVGETTVASNAIDTYTAFGKYWDQYILVGYKIDHTLVTLPSSMQLPGGGNLYGKKARAKKLGMYIYKSIGLSYGQEGDELQGVNFHNQKPAMNQSPLLYTGFKDDFDVDSSFDLAKEIRIEQNQPYPLTILALIPEF